MISGGKRYEGMFNMGRPWGVGAKVSRCKETGVEERVEGYWD